MNKVKIDLSADLSYIEIHTLADLHIGDHLCDRRLINKRVAEIADNPNAYVICNGDIINNATKTSVSDCYAEELSPMEQLAEAVALLSPIKDKILLLTQGNHEARTYRNDGIDLTRLVSRQLGIEDRYVREGGVLFLRFGKKRNGVGKKQYYTLYVTHGRGGGRKEGAKAIRLADMACIVDCDIYVHSHTHLPMTMKQTFFRINGQNSSVAEVERLFVNTAAQLDYGGYGQTNEFKPGSKKTPVIYLDGCKKEFTATL